MAPISFPEQLSFLRPSSAFDSTHHFRRFLKLLGTGRKKWYVSNLWILLVLDSNRPR